MTSSRRLHASKLAKGGEGNCSEGAAGHHFCCPGCPPFRVEAPKSAGSTLGTPTEFEARKSDSNTTMYHDFRSELNPPVVGLT
jgi:hypothetical protein